MFLLAFFFFKILNISSLPCFFFQSSNGNTVSLPSEGFESSLYVNCIETDHLYIFFLRVLCGREQMQKALQKLQDEVGALQREEQEKLEEEKKKALEKLHKQV